MRSFTIHELPDGEKPREKLLQRGIDSLTDAEMLGWQDKIGSVEKIRDLVNLQLPGIALRPLPVAPRQLPFHAGFTYFELDRGSEYWAQLATSAGFAMHVAGEFPGLQMEFWAIRK